VTPSVTAPSDSNVSDATGQRYMNARTAVRKAFLVKDYAEHPKTRHEIVVDCVDRRR